MYALIQYWTDQWERGMALDIFWMLDDRGNRNACMAVAKTIDGACIALELLAKVNG